MPGHSGCMIKWGGVYNLLNTGPGSASNAWQKGRSGAALFWSNPYLSPHPIPAKHFTDTETEMLRHQAKGGALEQVSKYRSAWLQSLWAILYLDDFLCYS